MEKILKKIYESKLLSNIESYILFKNIIKKKINNVQLASLLIAIKIRGESSDEISGAIRACLEEIDFPVKPNYDFSDIVGTGGDKNNTINISTVSAIVAATCGLKIAKHCNSKISSRSGSSDVLDKLGINYTLSSEQSYKMLDEFNICFLFAPQYHTVFKNAIRVRKTLQTKTLFNILGPLLNPFKPPLTVIGVYNKPLVSTMIKTLRKLDYKRAIVLHSGGNDEIMLFGNTYISELNNKKIISYEISAKDFGLHSHSQNALKGGSSKENCDIIKKILQGRGNLAHEETIAANVAILLKIFGHENIKENAQYALEIIRSGKAYKKLISLINWKNYAKYNIARNCKR
ncbi:anthranilate phosphoribosyltransferase [Buchnera aphidicola (Pemphigus obesinymphae)]|uniref:anthranilate phosphoribosyltransferase n=1 Tax=Buchnera aphidicola TaxID=9 RepID=UPI0022376F57|nr:anthranilate phosphoribosyltransferase [Buchnera aphidicola]MCW5196690.1 anthranilate phosphoribosyltransferase [Buchnera aphidicola (Pemphigus obesinymphae)]